MPVVDARGVIGRLWRFPNYSKVLLIIDQNSAWTASSSARGRKAS